MDTMPSIENINDEIENFRQHYKADDLLKMLDDSSVKTEVKSSLTSIKTANNEANRSDAQATSTARSSGRGAGRGAGTRAASTRAKAKLDVSINSKVSFFPNFTIGSCYSLSFCFAQNSSNGPQGLLDACNRGRRTKAKITYVVSDDSD